MGVRSVGPRHQRIDVLVEMAAGEPGEEIAQVSVGFHAVHLAGADQAGEARPGTAALVVVGKIADILQAQGELDAELEMHLSRLPDAQERQDADSIAHIRYSCAGIRLARIDHERGELQVIYDELAEAFSIMMQTGRADWIGGIGLLLGQVLAMAKQTHEVLTALGHARAAVERFGDAGGLAHCDNLIEMISTREAT